MAALQHAGGPERCVPIMSHAVHLLLSCDVTHVTQVSGGPSLLLEASYSWLQALSSVLAFLVPNRSCSVIIQHPALH